MANLKRRMELYLGVICLLLLSSGALSAQEEVQREVWLTFRQFHDLAANGQPRAEAFITRYSRGVIIRDSASLMLAQGFIKPQDRGRVEAQIGEWLSDYQSQFALELWGALSPAFKEFQLDKPRIEIEGERALIHFQRNGQPAQIEMLREGQGWKVGMMEYLQGP